MVNKKIVDYKVLSSDYRDDLSEEVVDMIEEGWTPYGELKAIPWRERYADAIKYIQVMVKEEEDN